MTCARALFALAGPSPAFRCAHASGLPKHSRRFLSPTFVAGSEDERADPGTLFGVSPGAFAFAPGADHTPDNIPRHPVNLNPKTRIHVSHTRHPRSKRLRHSGRPPFRVGRVERRARRPRRAGGFRRFRRRLRRGGVSTGGARRRRRRARARAARARLREAPARHLRERVRRFRQREETLQRVYARVTAVAQALFGFRVRRKKVPRLRRRRRVRQDPPRRRKRASRRGLRERARVRRPRDGEDLRVCRGRRREVRGGKRAFRRGFRGDARGTDVSRAAKRRPRFFFFFANRGLIKTETDAGQTKTNRLRARVLPARAA